jgi:hypothetical protein
MPVESKGIPFPRTSSFPPPLVLVIPDIFYRESILASFPQNLTCTFSQLLIRINFNNQLQIKVKASMEMREE